MLIKWKGTYEHQPKEEVRFFLNQVVLQHELYSSMLSSGSDTSLDDLGHIHPSDAHALKIEIGGFKPVLDYINFINILSQFGRVSLNKYGFSIPLLNRIKFYRNKVAEHWDEYSLYVNSGSYSRIGSKPAIPHIASVGDTEKRKILKNDIDTVLAEFNIKLDLENSSPLEIWEKFT